MKHQPDSAKELAARSFLEREHAVAEEPPVHGHPADRGRGPGHIDGRGTDPSHDLLIAVGAMQSLPVAVAPLAEQEALRLDLVHAGHSRARESARFVSSTSRAICAESSPGLAKAISSRRRLMKRTSTASP